MSVPIDPSTKQQERALTTEAAPADDRGEAKGDAKGDAKPDGPRGSLAALALGALGVVYGDIGASPLY